MTGVASPRLVAVLGLSLVAAGYVYGLPLLRGDDVPEPPVATDLGFVSEDTVVEVEPWTPPAEPRNPFLHVDLGGAGAVAGEADEGDGDG